MRPVYVLCAVRVHALPGQIVITDQQQVLHQGQEVAFSFGVLHSVDQNLKHFPHIIEAKQVKAQLAEDERVQTNR